MIKPISKANNYGKSPHSFEGDIYANGKLLRKDAAKSFRKIENANQFKATLRAGEFTFPGGYRLFFVTSDGAALSFSAALENFESILWSIKNDVCDGWQVCGTGCTAEYQGVHPDVFCDHTGEEIA